MLEVSDGQQSVTGRKRRTVRSNYLRPIIHFLNSMKQLMKVRIDRPSMSVKQIFTLNQKRLFQSVLIIACFGHCLWSITLKKKLEGQNTSAEQQYCKTEFAELVLLTKTSRWLLLDNVLPALVI